MNIKDNKTAIVIGATGLVGKHLVEELLKSNIFQTIKLFARRKTGFNNKVIEEYIIDFNNLSSYKQLITGDCLFSCLGTTLKQAGGKRQQYTVDYTYQYEFAKIAVKNGVSDYFLVSSPNANKDSIFFYSRIKGELEDAISMLGFSKIRIISPSILVGEREAKRKREIIAAKFADSVIKFVPPLKKYKSIKGIEVAKAIIGVYNESDSKRKKVYCFDQLFQYIK